MGLYSKFLLPRLVRHVCSRERQMRLREAIVPLAAGRVLEIGFGSGLNLGLYSRDRVSRLWGLDPSPEAIGLAERRVREAAIETELLEAGAEAIPLEARSVDTIVLTWSLCTIGDRMTALSEMRRVLADGGHILFCEHGVAPDPGIRRWQRWMNPAWTLFSGGCELTVDVPALFREAGLEVEWMDAMYVSGFRLASYNYRGVARPR
jgi:ubiquinone/menaquinone biosynthesis C-methylase UbiE